MLVNQMDNNSTYMNYVTWFNSPDAFHSYDKQMDGKKCKDGIYSTAQ